MESIVEGETDFCSKSVGSVESRRSNKKKSKRSLLTLLKSGLFGVLFITVKDSSVQAFAAIIEIVVDAFQVLAFPFSHRFNFPWNHAATDWFARLCSIFVPEVYVSGQDGWFLAGLALVIIMLADVIIVGYSFSRKSYKMMWTIKLLRTFGGLFSTILFIPLLGLLTGKLSCDYLEDCATGIDLTYKIVSVIVSLLFIFFALCTAATFYDQDPKGRDVLARPHARIDLFYLLVRTVLTIMQNIVPVTHVGSWIFIATMVAGSLASAFLHTWYIPYYRFSYSKLRNATQWLFASGCLCVVLAQARNNPDQTEASVLFFLSSPMVVALSICSISARRRALFAKKIRMCRDPYEVELRIRFALEYENMLFAVEDESDVDGESNGAQAAARLATLRSINAMYAEAVKRRPTSSLLHVFWAHYYLLHLGNSNMALAELANAEGQSPPLDEQFLIYRRQSLLSEAASQSCGDSGVDIIAYVQYQKHLADSEKFDRRVAGSRAAFWTELGRAHPDMQKLHSLGELISLNLSRAIASYESLLKLAPESPQVLRMYASFLMDIMNEVGDGEELVARAENIEDALSKTAQSDDCGITFDERNATITISGVREREGIILDVNMAACRLFGYRRHDMIGKNVNMLIPSPIAKNHNRIVANYLASGYGSMLDRKRKVVCIHANGYIVPANIVIRQAIDPQGSTCFVGVLRAIVSQEHFVVLDPTGKLLSCTAGVTSLFDKTIESINDGEVHITSIIPEYATIADSALAATKGSVKPPVLHQVCGVSQSLRTLTISCERMESLGEFIDIVSFSAVSDEIATEHPLPQFGTEYLPSRGMSDVLPPLLPQPANQTCINQQNSPEEDSCATYCRAPPMPRRRDASRKPSGHSQQAPSSIDYSLYGMPDQYDTKMEGEQEQATTQNEMVMRSRASVRFGSADISQPNCVIQLNEVEMEEGDSRSTDAQGLVQSGVRASFDNANDNKKKKSVGGSIASSGGTETSMRQRTRTIIEDKNDRSAAETLCIKRGSLLAVTIVIGLAIASIILLRMAAAQYKDTVVCVTEGGTRRLDTVTVARDVRTLALAAANMSVDVQLSALREELMTSAMRLKEHQAKLFTGGHCLTSQLESTYLTKAVPMLIPGSGTQMMNLWEAVQLYVMKAMQIAARDPSTLMLSDEAVQVVLENGPFSLLDAIEHSSNQYEEEVSNMASFLRMRIIILSAVPLSCIIVIFVVVILPALLRLETRKAELMRIFLAIPRRVVRTLIDKDRIRLELMLARADFAHDMELDDGYAPQPSTDGTHRTEGDITASASGSTSSLNNARRVARTRETWTRRASSSLRAQRGVLLRLLVLVIACASYCIALLVVGESLMSDVGASGKEINWSDRRSSIARLVFYHTRESVVADTIAASVESASMVTAYTNTLLEIEDGLLYGSVAMDVVASVRRSDISELMFGNGCAFVPAVPSGYPECSEFDNGIMTLGLNSAMFEYCGRAVQMAVLAANMTRPTSFEAMRKLVRTMPGLMFVRMMDWAYVQGPLEAATSLYEQYGVSKVTSFENFVLVISLVEIFAVALLWLFVFRPMTARIEGQIRNNRLMVLMVPVDEAPSLAASIRSFLVDW